LKKILKKIKSFVRYFLKTLQALCLLFIFFVIAIYARLLKKNRVFDVALGPVPMINNIYHKKALEYFGYSAKTLVFTTYFITDDFDYKYHQMTKFPFLDRVKFFYDVVTQYKMLYTYFDGTWQFFKELPSPLVKLMIYIEPRLYQFALLKLVVMPYGGDIHDMNLCPNLAFKNALSKDYPKFQRDYNSYIQAGVRNWLKKADHVIAGCDWVYYLHSWHTLLSAHFSIDTHALLPQKARKIKKGDKIKIFHSPNHTNIKGTRHFEKAINNLKAQGYNVELVFVQKRPNKEILELIRECDIVADQLIIGWYAMTALEAMCFAKPILCYLDENLINTYEEAGILTREEIPFVNCNYLNVESQIKNLLDHPELIESLGIQSRKFVEKYHSLEYMGSIFDKINRDLGVLPNLGDRRIV
jgi:glycosyltransferase involved in cell wall biosynthesis